MKHPLIAFLTAFTLSVALLVAPFSPAIAATDVKNDDTLATGLVSYWMLDEASGTRVDVHGANDLADTNTTAAATGVINDGADFERTNSELLSITDASQSGLDISGDISFSAWVKLESAGNQVIVGKGKTVNQVAYGVWIEASSNRVTADFSSNGTFTSPNFQRYRQTTGTLANGVWSHVVVTFNIGTETCVIYVNGSSVTSSKVSGTTLGATLFNGTSAFGIGTGVQGEDAFDGVIDEVGIWSKELTSAEVTELYNGGAGLPYEAGGAPPRRIIPN